MEAQALTTLSMVRIAWLSSTVALLRWDMRDFSSLLPRRFTRKILCRRSSGQMMSFFTNTKLSRSAIRLKDYAVRALVNAVDHLGTVAFKLCQQEGTFQPTDADRS